MQFNTETKLQNDTKKELKPSKLNKICIFCGSSTGNETTYIKAAAELGEELVSRNMSLVYGGGSIGLMGIVARTIYNGDCNILGVMPKALMHTEITGESICEIKAVSDMHQRKAEMAKNSDAFITLPGGYGTLEELFEVVTWAQLGIHQKPVGLLNHDGFYNDILAFIDKAVKKGFITPEASQIIVLASTAKELMMKLEDYHSKHTVQASKINWSNEE